MATTNFNDVVISQSVAMAKTEYPTDHYMLVLIGDNPDPTEGKARFYTFDYTSTATPDDNWVIKPNFPAFNTVGRWLKVQIPSMQTNTDWNAISGAAQLLNKPTLATVATSGSYNDLSNKPSAYTYAVSAPASRTLSLGTAYQANTNTKPAAITITLTSSASLTLGGGSTFAADLVVGPTNAVAGGTGFIVATYLNSLTGTLVIGVAINNGQTVSYSLAIPTGWWFAVRQTLGTGISIASAYDQSLG